MILLDTHPQLADLHKLIDEVPTYPISVQRLKAVAARKKFSPEVISFYNRFSPDILFKNRDDITARTELMEILQTENPASEDIVHGAED